MNLSPSPINQTSAPAQSIDAKPASGLGLPASGRGVDAGLFADILSRHWQHLAQNQRQDLAASADATLAAAGRVSPSDLASLSDSRALDHRTQEVRHPEEPQQPAGLDQAQPDERLGTTATLDALDAGRLPAAPAKPIGMDEAVPGAPVALLTDDGLMVLPLGDRINIVTPPLTQVNEKSVADFARSMGMSELQIEQLFGPQAAHSLATEESASTLERLRSPGLGAPQTLTTALGASGLSVLASGDPAAPNLQTAVANPTPAAFNSLTPLNTQILIGATQHPALAAQVSATSDATPTAATSVDVLTIMEADFAPEVWQALQSRIGGAGSSSLLTGATLSAMGASGSAALAIPTDRSATLADDAAPVTLPGMASGPNAANRPRTPAGAGAQAGLMQAAAPDAQEAYEELNQKFTTELAARINQQINSGEWKMKFALKPASLGHLDVQLEMRDGKLSAVFQTDNAMTQDLLSTGSQRLKEALAQLGHNNASVWVGSGGSGQPQGQGRGQPPGSGAHAMSTPSDSSSGSTSAAAAPKTTGSSQSSKHLDLFA